MLDAGTVKVSASSIFARFLQGRFQNGWLVHAD